MAREDDAIVGSLVALAKQVGVTCLLDIGCEDGYEAERIYEATGCNAIGIDADIKCEPDSPRVEFHHALIGATDCVGMTFYVNTASGLSSQIKRGDSSERVRHLPQWRLDTFCREHDIVPDALIIDTEGTTLDVLEGATGILDGIRLIYAEVQHEPMRPGMRPSEQVDDFLAARGMTRHIGLPSYRAGCQSNWTWVRK